MRSESTSALGQPRETKLIFGAILSLITVLTWPAWRSAALAIVFSILVNALDPLLDLDAEPLVGAARTIGIRATWLCLTGGAGGLFPAMSGERQTVIL